MKTLKQTILDKMSTKEIEKIVNEHIFDRVYVEFVRMGNDNALITDSIIHYVEVEHGDEVGLVEFTTRDLLKAYWYNSIGKFKKEK